MKIKEKKAIKNLKLKLLNQMSPESSDKLTQSDSSTRFKIVHNSKISPDKLEELTFKN